MSTPTTLTPKKKLRCITYLSPGVPIEWFESILYYLEATLDCEGYIIHESRHSGPPPDRVDPFTTDDVDLGFMCSSGFIRLKEEGNKYISLCKAAPVHIHPNGQGKPVYFSDVVVRASERSKYVSFTDLKGHSFTYNGTDSLSGSLVVLKELKKLGYNSNFFGNLIHSGSHIRSLQMILDKKVDTAAIDSNVLKSFLKEHPEYREKLAVLTSFGPMPIYPIVFNARMPVEDQEKITAALLCMHKDPEWYSKMAENNVQQFVSIDESLYDMEADIKTLVKGLSISPAYY
ncbi:hypothetical protein FSP39_000684 [Pinctada imbricata]|uniref:Uncharacterized protein n=1 Tax=Pinctada imbricata TaxID=66713 RepID=A0AA88XFK7_PINIB|nr:hypothetical protein FSP39_000684 [Pinctada imbricata]